jgi:hypothetical protein
VPSQEGKWAEIQNHILPAKMLLPYKEQMHFAQKKSKTKKEGHFFSGDPSEKGFSDFLPRVPKVSHTHTDDITCSPWSPALSES